MKYRKKICLISLWIMVCFIKGQQVYAIASSFYVWDFGTRETQQNELTQNLTIEFEEFLIRAKCCTILERRNYDRLMNQKESEQTIMEMGRLPPNIIQTLHSIEAEGVIFGEVYDDKESGEIRVNVTVQTFDGNNIASESIRFSRGKRLDAETREEEMQLLSEKLCKVLNSSNKKDYTQESTEGENGLPKLKQGMPYKEARQMLIDTGWQGYYIPPLQRETSNEDYILNELGYNEVVSCAGTGMGWCHFEFTSSDKQRLIVITSNNEPGDEPILHKWWVETDSEDEADSE